MSHETYTSSARFTLLFLLNLGILLFRIGIRQLLSHALNLFWNEVQAYSRRPQACIFALASQRVARSALCYPPFKPLFLDPPDVFPGLAT